MSEDTATTDINMPVCPSDLCCNADLTTVSLYTRIPRNARPQQQIPFVVCFLSSISILSPSSRQRRQQIPLKPRKMASVRALTLFPLILSSIAQPVSPVRYPQGRDNISLFYEPKTNHNRPLAMTPRPLSKTPIRWWTIPTPSGPWTAMRCLAIRLPFHIWIRSLLRLYHCLLPRRV